MPAAIPHKGKDNEPRRLTDDEAALRGATLAFGAKPTVKPKPVIKNYSGNNGALAAALAVGTHLQPPQPSRRNSDSYLAANIAASRSPSLSPMNTGQRSLFSPAGHSPLHFEQHPNLPRSSSVSSTASRETGRGSTDVKTVGKKKKLPPAKYGGKVVKHRTGGNQDHVLDTTPIAPTNKLISIFEDKSPPREKRERPVPKPISTQLNDDQRDIQQDGAAVVPNGQEKPRKPFHALKPTPKSPKPVAYKAPATSQKLRRRESIRAKPSDTSRYDNNENDSSSSDDSFVSASDFKENDNNGSVIPSPKKAPPKPMPPPPRRTTKKELPPETRGRRPSISKMEYNHGSFIPHLTGDSLANAMVAGSLASSRATSPHQSIPIPPAKPHKHTIFHHHHTRHADSRTNSPAKGGSNGGGFRKTMRNSLDKADGEWEELMEKKGKKKLLINKHPNKHAEGDRKRWRDEITERERKRYEAVWASNKGLFLDSSPNQITNHSTGNSASNNPRPKPNQAEMVSNIAVRDIWKRSRLGQDVLEEVWDLVNRTQYGALTREEFVVGLWLIDQRLRGRKLPVKVSDSVWWSAGRVRVIPPKKRR